MMDRTRHNNIRHLVCSVLDNQPAAPTTVLYFVIAKYNGETYIPERDTSRMTRERTLQDIRSGELQDVTCIIETEFTPHGLDGHMHSRDVTEDMLAEAGCALPEFEDGAAIDARIDHALDLRKHWVA